jgi:hypothetical protein
VRRGGLSRVMARGDNPSPMSIIDGARA